jgi:hypothetical protein
LHSNPDFSLFLSLSLSFIFSLSSHSNPDFSLFLSLFLFFYLSLYALKPQPLSFSLFFSFFSLSLRT